METGTRLVTQNVRIPASYSETVAPQRPSSSPSFTFAQRQGSLTLACQIVSLNKCTIKSNYNAIHVLPCTVNSVFATGLPILTTILYTAVRAKSKFEAQRLI